MDAIGFRVARGAQRGAGDRTLCAVFAEERGIEFGRVAKIDRQQATLLQRLDG